MTDGCSQHSPAPPGDPKKKGHIAQAVFSDLRPTALKTWQLTLQEGTLDHSLSMAYPEMSPQALGLQGRKENPL